LRPCRKMKYLLASILALIAFVASSQDCSYTIRGVVADAGSKEALIGAAVWIEELETGEVSDIHGEFRFSNLCKGTYTITVHYLGYEELTVEKEVFGNTTIALDLKLSNTLLNEVTVKGVQDFTGESKTEAVVGQSELDRSSGKAFAESLSGITGVNFLRTGPSIVKPVIHGLHSNRVLILNNGIRQEGQQWGSEHAPEIDPFIASKVTVIKGAEAVKYGSDAIAGLILVEPPELHSNAKFGGEFNIGGMSNSYTGFISGLLEGNVAPVDGMSWRIQGTVKRAGDSRAPDYVLSNTGLREYNFSGTLGYNRNGTSAELYYSRFETELGILAAAHVGSLSDLEQALSSQEPLIIDPFTFEINNPRQDVTHNLLKAKFATDLSLGRIEFKYGGQINRRQEFDRRRGGRSSKPAIDMKLNTHSLDVVLDHKPFGSLKGEFGSSFTYQANRNIPGTGVEPLIPYYDQYTAGIFAIERWIRRDWEAEVGLRYDLRYLAVKDFDSDNNLVKPTYTFGNLSATGGLAYRVSDRFTVRTNLGTAWRQPNVAELFSRGLHHGAAAIEEGLLVENGELVPNVESLEVLPEKSYKWIATGEFVAKRFKLEGSFYMNWINDFIYLEPSPGDLRLTIRGAFPVYNYQQTNANLTGFDGGAEWNLAGPVSLNFKGSVLRGWDVSEDQYLVWMPADRIETSIHYELPEVGAMEDFHLSLGVLSVSRQFKVPENSDFAEPPAGYSLMNAHVGFKIPVGENKLGVYVNVDNLLNTRYRDYLNRFRYFADDLGRNITIKLKYDFHSHD